MLQLANKRHILQENTLIPNKQIDNLSKERDILKNNQVEEGLFEMSSVMMA